VSLLLRVLSSTPTWCKEVFYFAALAVQVVEVDRNTAKLSGV